MNDRLVNDKRTDARKRVVLFASVEPNQHEALRYIAFVEKRSIADVTREAIAQYVALKSNGHLRKQVSFGDIGERRASRQRDLHMSDKASRTRGSGRQYAV